MKKLIIVGLAIAGLFFLSFYVPQVWRVAFMLGSFGVCWFYLVAAGTGVLVYKSVK